MVEVGKDVIRAEIMKLVDDTTSYNPIEHKTLEWAIDYHVNKLHTNINSFFELEQESIDEQEEHGLSEYLYGVKVGDLVWGDDSMFVSVSIISDWERQSRENITGSHDHIRDIAEWVQDNLILEALTQANKEDDV